MAACRGRILTYKTGQLASGLESALTGFGALGLSFPHFSWAGGECF